MGRSVILTGIFGSLIRIVLILYDYFITLGAEVELFWKKKISRASVLFFLNRYLVLVYQFFNMRGQWKFFDLSVSCPTCFPTYDRR